MKRATEALVKSAQQVKEREDEANVQVNKRMVGGVAQVIHNIECVFPLRLFIFYLPEDPLNIAYCLSAQTPQLVISSRYIFP